MLVNDLNEESLLEKRDELFLKVDNDLKKYLVLDEIIQTINFPVIKYPTKVQSLSLDKNPYIEEKLIGIKGQYLIFENETVLNVRRHAGYLIEFSY